MLQNVQTHVCSRHHSLSRCRCLQACTPNKWVNMSNYNKQVAAAAKRNGAMFVDCNKGVANIKSKTLYRDGTHLAPAGQK